MGGEIAPVAESGPPEPWTQRVAKRALPGCWGFIVSPSVRRVIHDGDDRLFHIGGDFLKLRRAEQLQKLRRTDGGQADLSLLRLVDGDSTRKGGRNLGIRFQSLLRFMGIADLEDEALPSVVDPFLLHLLLKIEHR